METETLTIDQISRNPVRFFSLLVPLWTEVPDIEYGLHFTIFELLTKPKWFVDKRIYTQNEVSLALVELRLNGFRPISCGRMVRILGRGMKERCSGVGTMERDFPYGEMLINLRETIRQDQRHFGGMLPAVEHLIRCHTAQEQNNRARKRITKVAQ
ncbi:MAG: hypothetical protein WC802_05365 [Patescibacteria group bacterium]|jgi:hypothetical protein